MGKPILSSSKGAQDGNLHCYHLPKGILHFFVKRLSGPEGSFYTIETPTVELVPDWNHRYFFQYSPSSFTDDDITLEFTEQGFLSRIHSLIDDQTDEFIEKIAELATTAAEAAMTLPTAFKTRGMMQGEEMLVYEAKLDPFREEEVKALNDDLRNYIDPKLSFSATVPDPVNYQPDPIKTASQQAIYSRPPVLAEIALHHGAIQDRKMIRLPHPYLTHVVEIPRAPFVKTEFLIEFNDMAYPIKINIKKPSTAMAMIQVPINILNAIIALPAKLFRFQFNYDNSGHHQLADTARLPEELPTPLAGAVPPASQSAPANPQPGAAPTPLPDPSTLMPVPGTRGLGNASTKSAADLEKEVRELKELLEVANSRIEKLSKD